MSEHVERMIEDMITQLGKAKTLINQLEARIEQLEKQKTA